MEIVSLMFSSCIHSVLEIRLLRYSWYPCSPHEQLNTQASSSNLSQKPYYYCVYTNTTSMYVFRTDEMEVRNEYISEQTLSDVK